MEKHLLGITRNRLFEFENTLCFFGDLPEKADGVNALNALKMLYMQEPILGSVVELQNDGQAFLVTEQVSAEMERWSGDRQSLLIKIQSEGLDFSKKLFRFFILGESTLCIFAHTLVADCRSLFTLAEDFFAFYSKHKISAVPSEIQLYSDPHTLPSNVNSPITDRLSSDLDVSWQKAPTVFEYEDFLLARKKYFEGDEDRGVREAFISSELSEKLEAFSSQNKADVSSLVAFAFYEALLENVSADKKSAKLNVQLNQRLFIDGLSGREIGGYNGFVTVNLKNKKAGNTLKERAVSFHKEIYKKSTTCFSAFYNDAIIKSLKGEFADSAYMQSAGLYKNKASKNFAETYFCKKTVVGEFCSYNLTQSFFEGLRVYENVFVTEPLKMRAYSLITFIKTENSGYIRFENRNRYFDNSEAEKILDYAIEILNRLTQQ